MCCTAVSHSSFFCSCAKGSATALGTEIFKFFWGGQGHSMHSLHSNRQIPHAEQETSKAALWTKAPLSVRSRIEDKEKEDDGYDCFSVSLNISCPQVLVP